MERKKRKKTLSNGWSRVFFKMLYPLSINGRGVEKWGTLGIFLKVGSIVFFFNIRTREAFYRHKSPVIKSQKGHSNAKLYLWKIKNFISCLFLWKDLCSLSLRPILCLLWLKISLIFVLLYIIYYHCFPFKIITNK